MANDETTEAKKLRQLLKYIWAGLLSLSVASLAVTEDHSPWFPVLNGLIDLLQQQHRSGGPVLPAAGQKPTGPRPLDLPSRQKVEPAAAAAPAAAAPDVSPAHR
jgi:hypothetical protein